MNKVIKDGELITPEYKIHGSGETTGSIVPLETFLALADKSNTGVWLDAHEEVETIASFAEDIPVVALNFPVFADGRAYSSASILRRVLGYSGEIRAIGDVRVDQLEQMQHCGFNAYALGEEQDAEKAMGALLQGSSHSYQPTATRQPIFALRT